MDYYEDVQDKFTDAAGMGSICAAIQKIDELHASTDFKESVKSHEDTSNPCWGQQVKDVRGQNSYDVKLELSLSHVMFS